MPYARLKSIGFSVFSCILIPINALAQGPLSPPGAPAATMKTLEQVEPRIDLATVAGDTNYHHVISVPGSYYLSENIEVSLPSGIQINSPDVSLDLNGFTVSRISGSGGYGIYIENEMDRATVRSGSIVGFDSGIYGYYADSCLLEKLAVSGCTSSGIYAGTVARLVDCRAHDNPGSGIRAGSGSNLSGCTANNNQGTYGIQASSGSSLRDSTAYYNQVSYGIYVGSGSSLRGCTAYRNIGTGFSSYGIYAGSGCLVADCSSYSNSHTNNTTTASQGTGISARSGSTVEGCAVNFNQGDGIRVSSDSTMTGNTGDSNGYSGDGAGIHATGSDNRIDGNNVTDSDRGIDVDASGNFIARNTASGNTLNWDIASGNVCYVVQAVAGGAISGDSGGSSPGSSYPTANFTY
ncbi:right-handed parallel beta-helix repeat-containing protein [Pontiellaceae bacterium B1224]|nr:right-handed parallel beta-helix repeat-containing protein [Pontiellaceae bacterium B1224]